MANVLIVGAGGREHALGWKLKQSRHVKKVFFAPGNGGTAMAGTNVDIQPTDINKLLEFAQEKKIDLTVVGQEAALEQGIADLFSENGLLLWGPTKAAAQLETSKAFSADFMERHDIPRPQSRTFTDLATAIQFFADNEASDFVIKADGLAAGKGVVLPESFEEAEATLKLMMSGEQFGDSGKTIVVQEKLSGQEVSAFGISDGSRVLTLPFFQDHKPVYDGDKGPNTGGMGAYSPVPIVNSKLVTKIEAEIFQKVVKGMKTDGLEYRGMIYAGLFITDTGEPKVIEFNVRFGDPECQPMMMLFEDDLYELLSESASGKFERDSVEISSQAAATVCLASGGYPGVYKKDIEIYGLGSAYDNVTIFHAGTSQLDDAIVTNGGRVLNITGVGKDLKSALNSAYAAIGEDGVHFADMHYRKDIGAKAL